MGGPGSGNWYRFSTKMTVEKCSSLSISTLKEALDYGPGYGGRVWWTYRGKETGSISYRTERLGDRRAIRLLYTITDKGTDERQDYDYLVLLQSTRPYFGGVRWWFTCPLVVSGRACGRRVGRLYLLPGGKHFGCRHCYDLVYKSQGEDKADRLLYKAQKIRRDLGGEPGLQHPFPDKPKGMHWNTYWRLRRESAQAAHESLILGRAKFDERLARTDRRLRELLADM